MEKTKPIEWQQYKKDWVGLQGNEIICSVRDYEGFPCKAFALDLISHIYTDVDSAKEGAEELLKSLSDDKPKDFMSEMLAIFKIIIVALESKIENKENKDDINTKSTTNI